MGYSFQSGWHFINLPYLDQGGSLDDYDFVQPDYDVVGALTDFTGFLKGTTSVSSSYYLTQVAKYFSYEEDQKSFALRLIIHYIGDIHQPLHAVAEVDSTYPTGDRGGNSEKMPSQGGVSNLHALWDSDIYTYEGYPDLPLSSSSYDWYTTQASTLSANYPVDSSAVKAGDYAGWAQESLEVAQDYVYNGFTTGQIPSEEYQQKAVEELQYRMMVGARRLAEAMKDIYGGNSAESLFLQ